MTKAYPMPYGRGLNDEEKALIADLRRELASQDIQVVLFVIL